MDRITHILILLVVFNGSQGTAFHVYRGLGGKPFYYEDEDGRLVEVRRSSYPIDKRQCECYCLVAGDKSSIHCCIDCHVTESVCFPGSAHVTLHNGDDIKIVDLKVGDAVLTASEDGEVHTTEVLGFLTFDREVVGRYRKIELESGEHIILSRSHLVFTSVSNTSLHGIPRYAADVQLGQYLLVRRNQHVLPMRVVSSVVVAHKGAYVPLTSHGTLFVDNIKVSSYAAFSHDLSHTFLTPLRLFPSLLSYTPRSGDHPYVTFLKAFGKMFLPESTRYKASTGNQTIEVPLQEAAYEQWSSSLSSILESLNIF